MKNKAANAPITFEEIVMVMINTNTGLSVHTQIKRNDKTKSVLDISQAKHQYRFNYQIFGELVSLEDLVVFNLKSLNFHQPGIKKVGEIILFHLQLFFINKNNSSEAY